MKYILIPLISLSLLGCANIKGVTISEEERIVCAEQGCTVWTDEELEGLAIHFYQEGYKAKANTL